MRGTSSGAALVAAARLALAILVAAPAAPALADRPLAVSDCTTVVPPGASAVLAADVVCRSRCSNDPTVVCGDTADACAPDATCVHEKLFLGLGARLAFRRHRISFEHGDAALICGEETLPGPAEGRCDLTGPGRIEGQGGITVTSRGDLRVRNLVVDDAAMDARHLVAENLRFGPGASSTLSGGSVVARRLTVGSGGIIANAVVLENVTFEPWSAGVYATYFDLTGHDVRAAGDAVFRAEMGTIDLKRLRMGAPPAPPPAQPPEIGSVTAQHVRLTDSVVQNIFAAQSLELVRTQCVHSYGFDGDGPGTWGVCAGDAGQQPVTLPPIQPSPRYP